MIETSMVWCGFLPSMGSLTVCVGWVGKVSQLCFIFGLWFILLFNKNITKCIWTRINKMKTLQNCKLFVITIYVVFLFKQDTWQYIYIMHKKSSFLPCGHFFTDICICKIYTVQIIPNHRLISMTNALVVTLVGAKHVIVCIHLPLKIMPMSVVCLISGNCPCQFK